MLIGYARVSIDDQDLALRMDAPRKAGCKRTFADKRSGTKSDRPGRTVKGLVDLAGELSGRGVRFRNPDTRSPGPRPAPSR